MIHPCAAEQVTVSKHDDSGAECFSRPVLLSCTGARDAARLLAGRWVKNRLYLGSMGQRCRMHQLLLLFCKLSFQTTVFMTCSRWARDPATADSAGQKVHIDSGRSRAYAYCRGKSRSCLHFCWATMETCERHLGHTMSDIKVKRRKQLAEAFREVSQSRLLQVLDAAGQNVDAAAAQLIEDAMTEQVGAAPKSKPPRKQQPVYPAAS